MIRRHQLSRAFAALAVGGSLFGFATAALPAIAQETAPAATDSAASLSIAPLRVEVDSGDEGATVYLTNASSRELPVQARLFAWTQDDGNDVYAPSSELTVSPSISMIPPGETQIVRLLRKVGAGKGESGSGWLSTSCLIPRACRPDRPRHASASPSPCSSIATPRAMPHWRGN